MTSKIITFLFITFILIGCSSRAPQSKEMVLWTEAESQTRLQRSIHGDFFQLVNFYEPQMNKFFCGPTTGTILLNALADRISAQKPTDSYAYNWKKNYIGDKFNPVFTKFTQNTFLNEKTDVVKKRETFYGKPLADGKIDGGLKLGQFSQILEVYGLKTQSQPVTELTKITEYKKQILQSLQDSSTFVVINFDRKAMGQNGGGHISPLVAYDSSSDSFLVLDVNPVVTTWFWVTTEKLFAAMNTKDGEDYRGFVIVSPLSNH